MAELDLEYLSKIVTRFKGFKKPNDTQQLIMMLSSKVDRDSGDDKKLMVLIRAEKSLEKLAKARKAANEIINTEKVAKKKLETRKKIIWGSALLAVAEMDSTTAHTLIRLYESGYLSDSDKEVVKAQYEEAQLKVTSQN